MIRTTVLSAALVASWSPLGAQALSVLAGGVWAEYADSISGAAGFLTGRASASSPGAAGVLEASVSAFATGEWAVQFGGYGTALHTFPGEVAVGVAAGGEASNFQGGAWSGNGGLGPLLAAAFGSTTAGLGLALGGVRRVDGVSFATGTAAVQIRRAVGSGWAVEVGASGLVADPAQYLDVTGGVVVSRPRFELALGGGARAGELADDPWASVRLAFGVTPVAGLEVALGRYPPDITGFHHGVYATAGVRVNLSRGARSRWSESRVPIRVERVAGGRVRVAVEVDARSGDRVEIAGDWNGWLPDPLVRDGSGRWVIELRLDPGVYEFALVVNGAEWTVPKGATSIPDEFGGRVALLVVPRRD